MKLIQIHFLNTNTITKKGLKYLGVKFVVRLETTDDFGT